MEQVDDLGKIIIEKDGKEVECEILFTFDNEDLRRSYVAYTDHSVTESGRENIYVASYDPIVGTGELEKITSQEELQMVQEVLEQIASEEE